MPSRNVVDGLTVSQVGRDRTRPVGRPSLSTGRIVCRTFLNFGVWSIRATKMTCTRSPEGWPRHTASPCVTPTGTLLHGLSADTTLFEDRNVRTDVKRLTTPIWASLVSLHEVPREDDVLEAGRPGVFSRSRSSRSVSFVSSPGRQAGVAGRTKNGRPARLRKMPRVPESPESPDEEDMASKDPAPQVKSVVPSRPPCQRVHETV